MFLEERYENIIKQLEEVGRVTVKGLAREFEVTEDCIRKDLRELESQGKLKRVYGGAILSQGHRYIKPVDERKYINREAKSRISHNAVQLIEDGDTIFLDVSTNNLEIAKELNRSNKKLTIVTNMIEIVFELKENSDIRVICIGGEFNKEIGAIIGSAADRYIKKFTYNKCFIGVGGVNKETGAISTVNLEDGATKRTIIECSNQSYIVMEKEKYHFDDFYIFTNIEDITGIITEEKVDNL